MQPCEDYHALKPSEAAGYVKAVNVELAPVLHGPATVQRVPRRSEPEPSSDPVEPTAYNSDTPGSVTEFDSDSDGASEDEYNVEAITDHRRSKGKLEYLVSWEGYADDESSWEPAAGLTENTALKA